MRLNQKREKFFNCGENTVVDLRELKRNRSNANQALTKKQNEIKELMTDTNNASGIDNKLQDLKQYLRNLLMRHRVLHENLHVEDDIEKLNDYFDIEQERITNLRQRVHEWNELCSYQVELHDVHPDDSSSNAGLQ